MHRGGPSVNGSRSVNAQPARRLSTLSGAEISNQRFLSRQLPYRFGGVKPMCLYAAGVQTRPRGVRLRKPI
jgi:hypothetical protein